ncbi:hypothetical protein WA016_03649 [Myxococcus stipitatus]
MRGSILARRSDTSRTRGSLIHHDSGMAWRGPRGARRAGARGYFWVEVGAEVSVNLKRKVSSGMFRCFITSGRSTVSSVSP